MKSPSWFQKLLKIYSPFYDGYQCNHPNLTNVVTGQLNSQPAWKIRCGTKTQPESKTCGGKWFSSKQS
jgi:hypothetical protein